MSKGMFDIQKFTEDCLLIREKSPLIHNITNYVAMTPTANALLAIGASPIMSFCPEEILDLVEDSSAVLINLGCLDKQLVQAAKIAAAAALQAGKPWVLDPVGVGASVLRNKVASDLVLNYHPTIIRGNASEIIALAEEFGLVRENSNGIHGVDSARPSQDALNSGKALARKTEAVISISGETDYIIDKEIMSTIANGDGIMPKVTAMGCTASAITAAFAAVDDSPFSAALNAMAMMGVCGELAAESCPGTGSFQTRFLDMLSSMEAGEIAVKVRNDCYCIVPEPRRKP